MSSREPEVEVKIDEDGDQVFGNDVVGWKKINDTLKELDLDIAKYVKNNTPTVGWYQDEKGNLYQFSGSEWIGGVPNRNDIDKLEFLG